MSCITDKGWVKEETLKELRNQIELGSVYEEDYNNNLGLSPSNVMQFFVGYYYNFIIPMSIKDRLNEESYKIALSEVDKSNPNYDLELLIMERKVYFDLLKKYDTDDNLIAYYKSFQLTDINPFL